MGAEGGEFTFAECAANVADSTGVFHIRSASIVEASDEIWTDRGYFRTVARREIYGDMVKLICTDESVSIVRPSHPVLVRGTRVYDFFGVKVVKTP